LTILAKKKKKKKKKNISQKNFKKLKVTEKKNMYLGGALDSAQIIIA